MEWVSREKIGMAMRKMKTGKAAGPSGVCAELIIASGELGIEIMLKLCQSVLDGKRIPDDWMTTVVVPIFKGKGYVKSCGSYRGVKLLEHAMKIVERVLKARLRRLVNIDDMQFGFMPEKGQQMHYW